MAFVVCLDPPTLNWSVFYDRKQRIRDGKETTQTVRDCTKLREVDVLVWQCQSCIDAIRQVPIREQTYYHWRKLRRRGDGSTQGVEAGAEGERETSQGGFRPYTG